jgi:hypothetical protein
MISSDCCWRNSEFLFTLSMVDKSSATRDLSSALRFRKLASESKSL